MKGKKMDVTDNPKLGRIQYRDNFICWGNGHEVQNKSQCSKGLTKNA